MNAREIYASAVDAFNRGDTASFAALYAENAIVHDPQYPKPLSGRAAVEQDVADVLRAMPDARFTLGEVMQDGGTVAVEYGLSGTHLGPLSLPDGEVAPTGRTLDIPGAVFSTLDDDGLVIDERRYYDVASMIAQLGLIDAEHATT
ncbi:ester cyclase [Agromyces sp. Marseille-P2726]|uniref:ester cyclase n=1 Tax=Agromyces sp. Marseille-P2726 TaxID=2709132 RepID=UPI00156DD71A|nr:nuclear transport factor 2 family protein [Agromyces sp. Marseille-P2726]